MVKNLPALQQTLVLIPGSVRSPGERISYSLQYSWASLVAQILKNPPAMCETWVWWFDALVGKVPWRREQIPTLVLLPGESHGQRSHGHIIKHCFRSCSYYNKVRKWNISYICNVWYIKNIFICVWCKCILRNFNRLQKNSLELITHSFWIKEWKK